MRLKVWFTGTAAQQLAQFPDAQVTLVMTLLVRDEADIIAEHLEYHLGAGVDFVIATDHRSRDGTTAILESYQRAGVLRLIRDDSEFARQSEWQTRMARLRLPTTKPTGLSIATPTNSGGHAEAR